MAPPLSCSWMADAPWLEETGSWSTINHQLWSGIQRPQLFELSMGISLHEVWYYSYTRKNRNINDSKPASYLHFSRDLSDAVTAMKSHTSERFSATQILVRLLQMWKWFLILFQSIVGMSTVNLKAVLIHAMNTGSFWTCPPYLQLEIFPNTEH